MMNKSLAQFFRERQASLKRSMPLGSYLLKPVQRILKYHLLLQEIAKHFDPEEEGYDVVEEAIYTMTGVAWYINDMKRKHEHAVRLQEVQSLLLNWKGQDLTTYGELVLEGNFKVPRARHERTLFLFDRMLLITKRRGEHYVYKTHISSSTLLLIESAKDSLSFSVSHYKHIKQPHTVQAKTVEEKKLWAHHIKRIILENHPAAIPQKAKEAILEMDSVCPARYRYSPERLKKAVMEEFPREARQGRRQSEPTKQMLRRTEAPLQHANSEDALPDDRLSLEGGISSSDLGELDCGSLLQEEGFPSMGSSAERLGCSKEEVVEEMRQLDEFLLEDKQVAERGGFISSTENGQYSADEQNRAEPAPEQPPTDTLPEEKLLKEAEQSSDLSVVPEVPQMSEHPNADEDPEHIDLPSSSDAKTLSSGESSEEDEGEVGEESTSPSILPSSVLDKASAIAQHCSSSIRRGSLAQDDGWSVGCPSPRLPSRSGSMLSLRSESANRSFRLNSDLYDPLEPLGGTDLSLASPRDDGILDQDRSIRRRRDSTLSKQDLLLIGKIKNYYENAGNQDAAFSLRRRESLTYIPSGLVRSSVSRFNSIPRDEAIQSSSASVHPQGPDHVPTGPGPATNTETTDHMVSGQPEKSDPFREKFEEHPRRTDDNLPGEELRSSSEMIKILQAKEGQISRSQIEDRESNRSRDIEKPSRPASISRSCDPEWGVSALSGVEDSTSPPRTNSRTLRCFGEETVTLRATAPRVVQLRAEATGKELAEDSDQMDELDRAESKVRLLARRYSQRIRSASPVGRQGGQAGLCNKKSLACVFEEKESSGKPNLTLPPVSKSQSAGLPLSPVDPSPGAVSPGRPSSRSPLSPPAPTEGFSWPDVRELRSRYSDGGRSLKNPMSRSSTVTENMLDGGLRRHSSGSSSHLHSDPSGWSSRRPPGSQEERPNRLQRANSLDPRLNLHQTGELQRLQRQASPDMEEGYYIAAERPLTDDPEHKIIIMEKLPEAAKTASESKGEDDGRYVQIRSPTSREKISIMAVLDRCRAYQESDEYKQRGDTKRSPHESTKTTAASPDLDESQKTRSDLGQRNMVKNLRERFQSQS
ncbi:pleckstrin homology domain-containing family G member 3-like [Cyprinodon tularosa]|uniref:pleckstrin homology domain-containing family G member 3-like n=1 Tax=Cyprinodon tularosa TaxID=77115 RepID=UPI0018E216A0|nr:pleckstrin homology domain-containing family G member 3-like [Cyprinodon tularosa]